jgi:class 3 adenylate cyclase
MPEEIKENDVVALLVDIPQRRLRRGQVGTIIDVYPPNDAGFLLEFQNGVQADIDDASEILKLAPEVFASVTTLQEWAGNSRTFAILFTDIIDSTIVANKIKDEKWVEVLKRHLSHARELLAKYDHYLIKFIGDSLMVAFRHSSEALSFALELKVEPGDDLIEIRAGIHVGSASIVDNDLFGIMVSYAKRVESVDNSNGIQVSDFARVEIQNRGQHTNLTFEERLLQFHGFSERQKVWLISDPKAGMKRAMKRSLRPPKPI